MAKRLSWAIRIARAKARGHFTDADIERACLWNMCAIGERHGFPPLEDDVVGALEAFTKTREFALGSEFGFAVGDNDIPDAERIYAEIQALP